MAAGDRGSRGRGTYGGGGDRSRGTSHRGGGRSGEGKQSDRDNRKKESKRSNMNDLNDKFGGRDYGKTTDGKKGSDGKTTGSSKVTNEVRRDPNTGKWTNVHTDYSQPAGTPGRTKKGKVQHGRVTDDRGTREYTGKAGDEAFGRDVAVKGAKTSAEIAERFMEASQYNQMADDSWQGGDYSSWAKFKAKYAKMQLGTSIQSQIEQFQQAPLDVVAEMLKNPLIGGAAVMSGLGMTAFGVTAVDAITDYMQAESTPAEALTDLAAGALDFTPVGAALGPVKSIARAALDSPEQGAIAAGGLLGTKIGTGVAPKLAGALTNNPMVGAAVTAAGVAGAGIAGRKAVETAMKGGTAGSVGMESPDTDRDRGSDAPVSRLASSGKEAVKASKKLAEASKQPVDLYAKTVRQLPYYGLQLPNQQLPMYGV